MWKNINNFITLLIRERGVQTDGMQTALIIKSCMPFSFIFTMSNSFKYKLFSENVLIFFSFLILFQFKSSFTFSFRNVLWLRELNSMRNMDFLFHSNYWHKFWVFVPKRLYFCSCRIGLKCYSNVLISCRTNLKHFHSKKFSNN